jgi:serine/threonine protein phosphatase PrpC
MALSVWCQTDVGLRRENNQDFVLFDEEIGLYIVADGMGGHRGGEVASRMAAETLLEVIRKQVKESGNRRVNPRMVLTQAYEEASKRIYETSQEPGTDLEGMGTTLVAALLHANTLYVANVGDSRAYMFKNKKLWQITEDHSLLNEQLRAGIIGEKDIARFMGKNVITRSVGFEREVQVDVIERDLAPGELFLLCSDGLSGLVTDDRIAEICLKGPAEDIVSTCIREAKENGGDDNVTVMVLYAEPQTN